MEPSKSPRLPQRPRGFPIHLTTTGATSLGKARGDRGLQMVEGILDRVRVALVILNVDVPAKAPQIVFVNEAFRNWFGASHADVIGNGLKVFQGVKTDPEILENLRQAAINREPSIYRAVVYSGDGSEMSVELEIYPVNDGKRRGGLSILAFRPGSGSSEQVEALRLGGERFSQAFEYGPVGMALVAPDGRWLTVNRRLCDATGYSAEELRKTTFQRVTHPDDLPAELELAGQMLRDELPFYHLEKRMVHRDGHVIWVHVTVSLVRDKEGHPLYFIKQVQDITESKRATEKLARQAELLDKTNDAIVLCDMTGRILYWNKGAETIFGWTPEEADGRQVRDLFKDNMAEFEKGCRETLGNGKWTNESPILRKDGREIVIQSHWSLISDRAHGAKTFLIISYDITDRKSMEAQLLRAQRMESIGTLAGGIAHDLNNILTPILMSIEMLKATSTHPRAKAIIETIETISRRGADIVRQVLSFARGMKGEHVEVQPRHLLKDIQALIKETLPKNIQLKYNFPHELWTFHGDPTQLHQIVMNLCVNARDAMPNGGTLSVSAQNVVIDESYAAMQLEARRGRYVALCVSDTGTGIPAHVIDKIFDPFFTTKEIGKGTGLGLSTVIAIVKSHHGFIDVKSTVGEGTTFKVHIPASEHSTASGDEEKALLQLPRGQGETILVVDDEASILTITAQTLETFGYKTLMASDGAEAVAIYAENRDKIDVVLTDMAMPIMDGAATIRALRKLNPTVKIIAASGLKLTHPGEQPPVDVKFYLDKPYTAGTLLWSLRSLIKGDASASDEPVI